MTYIALGLMSGSSMDGIDAAIIETDGQHFINPIVGFSITYSPYFRWLLRAAEYAAQEEQGCLLAAEKNFKKHLNAYYLKTHHCEEELNAEHFNDYRIELNLRKNQAINLATIIRKLTEHHAKQVQRVIAKAGIKTTDVDVIGFHGQNLYHNPQQGITHQVGDGQLLADLTNTFVVHQFRTNDVRHGGQGAPFAPLYHRALAMQKELSSVAIINCGGIANVTYITGPNDHDLIGFDVGPGNVLIDRYIREKTAHAELMDKDGKYGLTGTVNQAVLQLLKEKAITSATNPFLQQTPPKSLDARQFTLIPELDQLSLEDAAATLEAFTARCIVDSLDFLKTPAPATWVLAGGGWKNPVITHFLKLFLHDRLGSAITICTADEMGWNSQFMEAELFAYLATRSLKKLPISLPTTTQVPHPMLGGQGFVPTNGMLTTRVAEQLTRNPDILTGFNVKRLNY